MSNNKEVLLKVENLQQFFKMGRRENKAVNGVSFEIYKGEVFGLVGESGCGKSTTGRSIIRLYDITGGSIYFNGTRIAAGTRSYKDAVDAAKKINKEEITKLKQDKNEALSDEYADVEAINVKFNTLMAESNARLSVVVDENAALIASAKSDHANCNKYFAAAQVEETHLKYKALIENETDFHKAKNLENEYKAALKSASKDRIMNKVQMIFQDPISSLNPRMTVKEIIGEGLVIKGVKDQEFIDKQVFRLLELVGLVPEHASRYPHEFSGGQRQRIGIARAIIMNPELIIADEPISALDVSIQAQVINLLSDLSKSMGLTTLFIAHDLAVVKYFSDRIAVMYFGKIVELATSDELFNNPLHPYTKSLLSAIPVPDPELERSRTRSSYNPISAHDYTEEGPVMQEVKPGHFVYCNSKELEEYKKNLK